MWKKLLSSSLFSPLFAPALSFRLSERKGQAWRPHPLPSSSPPSPWKTSLPASPSSARSCERAAAAETLQTQIHLSLPPLAFRRSSSWAACSRRAHCPSTRRREGERCSSDGSEAGHSASDRGGRGRERKRKEHRRSIDLNRISPPANLDKKTSSFHQKQPAPFSGAYVPRSQDEEAALCLLLAAEEGSDEVRESV